MSVNVKRLKDEFARFGNIILYGKEASDYIAALEPDWQAPIVVKDGRWPDWGDSPNGFDGPGGAE